MADRSGILVDGRRGGHLSGLPCTRTARDRSVAVALIEDHRRPPLLAMAIAVVLLATALALVPGRTGIPPLVESDYCYLLVAADRLHDGLGLTAPPPVAPLQPWEWHRDWTFLTQWPMGYPLLVCGIRWVFGLATLQACQWISVLACAAALVSWFVWIKRCVPRGMNGILIAGLGAGCAVSTASLLNPSTDIILVAALPIVLMFAARAVSLSKNGHEANTHHRAALMFVVVGLLAGGLFWIRYAALFVPLAVGAYFIVERLRGGHVSVRQVSYFAVAAAFPIAVLVLVNRALGDVESSMQAQLNLGHSAGFYLSSGHWLTLWRKFTEFGFYDYHWFSRWIMSLLPPAVVITGICFRPTRQALRSFFATSGVLLSICTVAGLFVMLLVASTVFGDKYDYISLERYYTAVKPLYFVLFVAPLILIPKRIVRVGLCVAMLVASSWLVQQEWSRTYKRRQDADRAVTPYGQWACCFSPGAAELYRWLGEQRSEDLIVVSNFHEYIALETGIPALPIPSDVPTLTRWIERICDVRGVTDPHVLFILDRDNRWRDYWISPSSEIIDAFHLHAADEVPRLVGASVLIYSPPTTLHDAA